ncbi:MULTISPECIES: winged helix DNA-binding domain-containing protein [unclassified Agromyces]|uniref:winged helix DNA-binding domain-containing protein n=1 Tax=unclassified Agromyces TaxID=2639701 RepID=UPI0030151A1F
MPRSSSPAMRAARIASHGFRSPADDAVAVVERLGALQAQDLGAAKWAIGSRMAHASVEAVDAAIESRRIVRSWPMRGTLHLMPARLLRPVLKITGPRVLASSRARLAQLELDDVDYRLARDAAERLLAGCGSASRDELTATWEAAGIRPEGQRGYHLIAWLARDGVLCCGPVDGRTQRFALLDEWAPAGDGPTARDETLGELFSAYVTGHGPATIADFAWWAGVTKADAKTGLAAAGDRVEPFDDEHDRFVAAGSMDGATVRPRGALALAAFDEYFLGYADRSAVCEPRYADFVIPGGNGIFQPLLVLDGRVVGTWRRHGASRTPRVELRWFERMPEGASDRFLRPFGSWARFHGVELQGSEATVLE